MEVLYPMAEKKLGAKGKEAAAHAAGEHAKIERDLTTALEKRKVGAGAGAGGAGGGLRSQQSSGSLGRG